MRRLFRLQLARTTASKAPAAPRKATAKVPGWIARAKPGDSVNFRGGDPEREWLTRWLGIIERIECDATGTVTKMRVNFPGLGMADDFRPQQLRPPISSEEKRAARAARRQRQRDEDALQVLGAYFDVASRNLQVAMPGVTPEALEAVRGILRDRIQAADGGETWNAIADGGPEGIIAPDDE